MNQGLGYDEGDDQVALLSEAGPITRGALRRGSDELRTLLRSDGVHRVLVCTDDPSRILTAVDACHRAGADLWIAHTNVPSEFILKICDEFDVGLVIRDSLTRREVRAKDAQNEAERQGGSEGSSRIHMMTSGTTGQPKIAAHTLDSLLGRVRAAAALSVNQGGTWLLTYQTTGFAGVQVLLNGALSRSTVVVPAERTPAKFYAAAEAHGVTHVSATPTFWRSFLMVARPGVLRLRQVTIGGEAVDQSTLDRVRAAFPDARITHIYASTEAGAVFAVHDGLEGFPAAWLEQVNQGVSLRIRDGFLQIKSPHAMRRYVSTTDQPHLDDGWIGTADSCEIVGDRVRFLGRQDSTINVGGSKVYPLAVETVLLAMPEVAEARVFGVPNPVSGALVGADVVLAAGVDDPAAARKAVLKRCREQLAGYQVPRVFNVVEALEVGASGKKG